MSDTILSAIDSRYGQRIRRMTFVVVTTTFLIAGGSVWTASTEPLLFYPSAENDAFTSTLANAANDFLPLEASIPRSSFTARDLINHPDKLHGEYVSVPFVSLNAHNLNKEHLMQFRDLLNIYESRQAQDDNFTVRVIDRRTSGLLERYTLEDVRHEYLRTGHADWKAIDELRKKETSRLIVKYRRRGVPVDDIMVKWGRLDQVRLARERDLPYIEYEVSLSHTLGMSLLATELGTVETFNSDTLVSTVGARGRYQMMPYMLRRFDIRNYTLSTRSGEIVEVREEWHPLLTMAAAFTIIKAYGNAVGHEIPGISAYHTGPFNIFFIYNMYLQKNLFSPSSTVMDAYLWALTEGFDEVSADTGFRTHSRSYVATAYGSFKGTEKLPVDTTKTHLTERVQTSLNADLYLSDLLLALAEVSDELDWSFASGDASLYNKFRSFNPHINLPERVDSSFVPTAGDIYLTTRNERLPIRFFLPLGATRKLKASGFDKLSDNHLFAFDHDTYKIAPEDITVWDRHYADLVNDVRYFGFTRENRDQLNILVERFEKLADAHPSNYRTIQLRIIKMHQSLWRTRYWNDLASITAAYSRQLDAVDLPPSTPMGLTKRISVADIAITENEGT